MRIWEHTFKRLTGGILPVGDNDAGEIEMPFHLPTIVPITDKPGYATALIPGRSLADQVLLNWRAGEWVYVGHYEGDTLMLHKSARGQGLGEELILRCAEHRNDFPISSLFTRAGHSLLKRTHRLAIKRALEAGIEVPPKVMAEYAQDN